MAEADSVEADLLEEVGSMTPTDSEDNGVSALPQTPADVGENNLGGNLSQLNIRDQYRSFLQRFHCRLPHVCTIEEHLMKCEKPPKYREQSFDMYDLFLVVRSFGGLQMVDSWNGLARRLGFETKNTNIAARIKEWASLHHIDAFFDYVLGSPNMFFTDNAPPPPIEFIKKRGRPRKSSISNSTSPEFALLPDPKRARLINPEVLAALSERATVLLQEIGPNADAQDLLSRFAVLVRDQQALIHELQEDNLTAHHRLAKIATLRDTLEQLNHYLHSV